MTHLQLPCLGSEDVPVSVRVLRRRRTRSSSQFRVARVLFFWFIPVKNHGLLEFCCLFVVVIRHLCCFMKVNLQFPSRRSKGENTHHRRPSVESRQDKNGFPAFPGNNLSLVHSVILSVTIWRNATGSPEITSVFLRTLSGCLKLTPILCPLGPLPHKNRTWLVHQQRG